MEFVPHNYQRAAIDFVKGHKDSALLLDCGLGKTVILLTSDMEMRLNMILVVCPKLVVDSWLREADKWDHLKGLKVVAIQGNIEKRMKAVRTPANVYVISRDFIAWFASICNLNQFDMIVMDESSSFKDETAARTQALIGHYAPRKVILTGTPMPKGIEDLYSQYKILDGGARLGSDLGQFRCNYMLLKDQRTDRWEPAPGAEAAVFERVSDITMSMKSDAFLKLPPITTIRNEVQMSSKEKALFNQMQMKMCLEYDGVTITADNAGTLTNKLAQLSNGFFYDDQRAPHVLHKHKDEMLESLLEATAGLGENVIVAYNFQEDKARIEEVCKKMNFPALDLKKPKNVEKFIQPGEKRVALLHPKSGGMGLNLQEYCHRLMWYSLPYSYEEFYQTLKRVYRQGQKEHTYIHSIECLDSYDQRIREIVNSKGECNDRLLEATKYVVSDALKQAGRMTA